MGPQGAAGVTGSLRGKWASEAAGTNRQQGQLGSKEDWRAATNGLQGQQGQLDSRNKWAERAAGINGLQGRRPLFHYINRPQTPILMPLPYQWTVGSYLNAVVSTGRRLSVFLMGSCFYVFCVTVLYLNVFWATYLYLNVSWAAGSFILMTFGLIELNDLS